MAEVMAEVPNSRSVPSGHDEQFINPPGEDLHCIICFLPSKEPVLTRSDHKFCGQCLEEYILIPANSHALGVSLTPAG